MTRTSHRGPKVAPVRRRGGGRRQCPLGRSSPLRRSLRSRSAVRRIAIGLGATSRDEGGFRAEQRELARDNSRPCGGGLVSEPGARRRRGRCRPGVHVDRGAITPCRDGGVGGVVSATTVSWSIVTFSPSRPVTRTASPCVATAAVVTGSVPHTAKVSPGRSEDSGVSVHPVRSFRTPPGRRPRSGRRLAPAHLLVGSVRRVGGHCARAWRLLGSTAGTSAIGAVVVPARGRRADRSRHAGGRRCTSGRRPTVPGAARAASAARAARSCGR